MMTGSEPRTLITAAVLAILTVCSGAKAEEGEAPKTISFHGIRPTDPGGHYGLRNPERGLRIETLIAEAPGADIWGPAHHLKGKLTRGYSDAWWLLDAQRYGPFGLTLAQTYCYLDQFMDRPISEEKLQYLQRSLDNLRNAGLKAVLRFAYEKEMGQAAGPNLETIVGHIDQLAPIIRENADVIYVMQAGFVGAWGEWHSSAQKLEADHAALAAIVAKVLDALPANRMTQVRVPKYKRWVLSEPALDAFRALDAESAFSGGPAARIGFNNDGFLAGKTCGGTWPEAPHFSNPGNPEFDYMTQESPYVPVDGELFWADQGGKVDGLRAAVRMRLHHYSSFSLAHSYSEREGKPFSIDDWMKMPLSVEQVRGAKLPVSDGYFEDREGKAVGRPQFEYIRDHLGYRVELQRARFPRTATAGEAFPVEVELINRGFSVMHNPRPVWLVLIDASGRVAAVKQTDADPRRWQPYEPGDVEFAPLTYTISSVLDVDPAFEPGSYMVGLWLPDAAERIRTDARYAVRVANRDVPWWTGPSGEYGVNILGNMDIQSKQ